MVKICSLQTIWEWNECLRVHLKRYGSETNDFTFMSIGIEVKQMPSCSSQQIWKWNGCLHVHFKRYLEIHGCLQVHLRMSSCSSQKICQMIWKWNECRHAHLKKCGRETDACKFISKEIEVKHMPSATASELQKFPCCCGDNADDDDDDPSCHNTWARSDGA